MGHRSTSFFAGALAAAALIFVQAAPAFAGVTNVDVEIGAGAYIGLNDSDIDTGTSYVGGVVVGFGNRWDLELSAVYGEARNETDIVFGAARPLEKIKHYSAGLRYYILSEKREQANRVFLMGGYSHIDGLPVNDIEVPATVDGNSDAFYFGAGFQWMLGESWGVVIKSPFYVADVSDSKANIWVPSISFLWRFD